MTFLVRPGKVVFKRSESDTAMNILRIRIAMAIAMLLTLVTNAGASAPLRLSPSDKKLIRELELESWDAW